MAIGIGRRQFMASAAGVAALWPFAAARAQREAPPLVGFVHPGVPSDFLTKMAGAFSRGLKDTGYVDGQNVTIEYHWAEGHNERLPAIMTDLLGRNAAAVFTPGGPAATRAAMALTKTVPIVFLSASDPISTGLVTSMNRPGGNITGVHVISSTLEAKRLELLHELAPKASTIAVIINPNYPGAEIQSHEVHEAAAHLGVKIVRIGVSGEAEIAPGFAALVQQGVGALLVGQDPVYVAYMAQFATLAARYAIPAIYSQRDYVVAGGLVSYGPDFAENYRQAGVYVGKILQGEKPADLPVVQPTKFELVINLKTAKSLGLAVPQTLAVAADEVIE